MIDPRLTFDLIPHVGVLPIRLDMTMDDLRQHLRVPGRKEGAVWFSTDGAILVNLDKEGRVELVELSWVPDGLTVRYRDVHLFDVPADDLVRLIARDARPSWRELGGSVHFYDLDIAFWRPELPSDFAETDPEDEYRNGRYWMTVAVARKGYFRAKDEALLIRFGELEARGRRPPVGFDE